jgi:hypothetical protein
MKKFFTNIKFFLIWGVNKIYSVKDLRPDTPISLPTFIFTVVTWFIILNYFLLF